MRRKTFILRYALHPNFTLRGMTWPHNSEIAVLVGSLRKESFTRKTAKALIALAPQNLKLEIVEIGQLPLYNQDLETAIRRRNGPPFAIASARCRA